MATSSPTFTEQARRAQLLQAAIDTVNEIGYPHASIAAIARRAGVAKSAVVYYFASKDALLMQVLEQVFTDLDTHLVRAVETATGPQEQLSAYLEGYLSHIDTHRAEITAGLEIVVTHRNDDGVPLYLADADEHSALLRGILRDGIDQGIFRPMPVRVAVSLVQAVLDIATTQLQRDLDADLTDFTAEIPAMVFGGLCVY